MGAKDIPVWEKYTLTIEEAARYFRIGEGKLRRLAEEKPTPQVAPPCLGDAAA